MIKVEKVEKDAPVAYVREGVLLVKAMDDQTLDLYQVEIDTNSGGSWVAKGFVEFVNLKDWTPIYKGDTISITF